MAREQDQDEQAGEAPQTGGEPKLSPEKLAQKQRLAEALRANLRRRKAQTRQRRDAPAANEE
jgi:hypothetical protein